jgi:hypothetical protein
MKSKHALNQETREFIRRIGNAEIVVGVPSYNNAATIGHVARMAAEGLARYFPGAKALLLNSDGGSTDSTREVFADTPASGDIHILATQYEGMPGKGTALKAVFEACALLGARGCVVVDSDLRSITPEWIKLLGEPLAKDGAGYIAPLYLRHKYDGTITNSIAYPLTRTLYGKRVRQPIGGDFGVARGLAEAYLEKDVWGTETARFGIDIFMTTTAIIEGFNILQANLGAKIHDPKDPSDLIPMLRQVVGTMFGLMKQYETEWLQVTHTQPVSAVGPASEREPEPVNVNFSGLVKGFREGMKTHRGIWEKFLSTHIISEVDTCAQHDESSFTFPAELWVKTVYEFAVAYNFAGLDRQELMNSLAPLYLGRTAAFIRETEKMDTAEANEVIERVAEVYEEEKPYLLDMWKRKRASG